MWFFFNYHKNRPSRTLPEEGFGPLKITKQFKRHESGRLGRQLSFLVIFLIHMLFPRLGNIFNFSVSNLNPERAIQTWELTGDNLFGVAIYRWLASGFFCSLPARGLKGSHLLSPGLHKTTETKDFSIFFFKHKPGFFSCQVFKRHHLFLFRQQWMKLYNWATFSFQVRIPPGRGRRED